MDNNNEETVNQNNSNTEEVVETVDNTVDNVEDNVEETQSNDTETQVTDTETQANNVEETVTETETKTEKMFSEKEILEKFDNISTDLNMIVQLAKEGFERRKEVISMALESGIHFMGNAFNKDVFEKTFSNMETKDIQEMADVWEKQVKEKFNEGNKVSKLDSKFAEENFETKIDFNQFKTTNY